MDKLNSTEIVVVVVVVVAVIATDSEFIAAKLQNCCYCCWSYYSKWELVI